MPQARVIYNPVAGTTQRAANWQAAQDALRATGLDFDVQETYGIGHATLLAQDAIQENVRLIICAGGDGTWNEVVNGSLHRNGRIWQGVELAVLPLGTYNNFCRSAAVPLNIAEAARRAAYRQPRDLDIGVAEYLPRERARGVAYSNDLQTRTRSFATYAAVGFYADLAEHMLKVPTRRNYLPAYLSTLWNHRSKFIRLTLDARERHSFYSGILIMNGQYAARGQQCITQAALHDARFEVLLLHDMDRIALARTLPGLHLQPGTEHPRCSHSRAQTLTIACDERLVLQFDGEVAGLAPISINLVEQGIRVRL